MFSMIEKITSWFNTLTGDRFKRIKFQHVRLEGYKAESTQQVWNKPNIVEAESLGVALHAWLFGKRRLISKLVSDEVVYRCYRSRETTFRQKALVEVIVRPDRILIGFFQAYEDGNEKPVSRYRVFSDKLSLRFKYRFISENYGLYNPVSRHDSEYSFSRDYPIEAIEIARVDLPEQIQQLLPRDYPVSPSRINQTTK